MASFGNCTALLPPVQAVGLVHVDDPAVFQDVVPVDDSVNARGVTTVDDSVNARGVTTVDDPFQLQGRVAVSGGVQEHYDWALALLVWIGTVGQKYYQNQTYVNTGETHQQWLNRVKRNEEVARREFWLSWNNRGNPVRRILPEDTEIAHIHAFVSILRDMCNTQRLKGIYPTVKGTSADVPLWDVIVKHYVISTYGPDALMGSHLTNQAPPLIV